jgi:ATP-dependent DNA helicase RecG
LRDLKLCEERGSGVDRAIDAIEARALPPPLFATVADSTVVTLFAERAFAAMSRADRLRACYQHACLRHQANDFMSNGSLRIRLGLSERQYPQVSKVISEAIEAGLISSAEQDQPNRTARYVPWWARPGNM